MTDTNGNVDVAHLYQYLGVSVARAMWPDLSAAAAEIRARGASFEIYLPVGGYRSLAVQVDMPKHLWPDPKYNLQPGVNLAAPGHSRHGFGKAVDVKSNLTHSAVVAIMLRHHFVQYDPAGDPNHFGWGNELTADGLATASTGSTPLEDEMELTDAITPETGKGDVNAYIYYARRDAGTAATNSVAALKQLAALTTSVGVLSTNAGLDPAALANLIGQHLDASIQADLAAIVSAVQAGDASILAAISQVDENTLATFGLKRA